MLAPAPHGCRSRLLTLQTRPLQLTLGAAGRGRATNGAYPLCMGLRACMGLPAAAALEDLGRTPSVPQRAILKAAPSGARPANAQPPMNDLQLT